jgi:hypothetical protein
MTKNLKSREYRTIILSVVLYGCETWPVTLREKHRLKVFENRMLGIFGSKKHEVTEGRRKLHNEELHNLRSSPRIFRMIKPSSMRWEWHVPCIIKKGNARGILVGKSEGQRTQGRPKHR